MREFCEFAEHPSGTLLFADGLVLADCATKYRWKFDKMANCFHGNQRL